MGNQHVIELNGKRYDALTGKIIDASPNSAAPQTSSATVSKVASIDGFTRGKSTSTRAKRQANQATAHKAEKSKTLMRTSVAKPKQPKPASNQVATPKSLASQKPAVDQKRLEHAKAVPKSAAISRFQAPKPITDAVTKPPVKQATVKKSHAAPQHQAKKTSKSFTDRALESAPTAENAPIKKEKRSARIARRLHMTPRQVSVGGFAVAFVLVVGFFVYQNSTDIGMRIASSRSGIRGNLPGYQPAGFGVAGGIAYSPGQITIPYKSTSDNRNFKIMQNVSEWNSQALMDNYVAVNHPNNQTVQDRGKTIYIYDGSNATWVDGGIWYRIEGDSQLNSDQLLNIAASL